MQGTEAKDCSQVLSRCTLFQPVTCEVYTAGLTHADYVFNENNTVTSEIWTKTS